MKTLWLAILGVAFAFTFILKAQDTSSLSDFEIELQALEATTPTPATNAPELGTFYSAQNPDSAPLPANVNNSPVWSLGDGFYVLDDTNAALAQAHSVSHASGLHAMGEMDEDDFAPALNLDTNSLYLQITNVSNGQMYLNLMNSTDMVYEIFSKTNLSATHWDIAAELFPAASGTNCLPFVVSPATAPSSLFIWARDWTGITSEGNTTPEWWFYKYYDTVDLSDTNFDSSGENTLLSDYQNGVDPNMIQFSLQFTNNDFNSSPANGTITVLDGVPSYIAVLVNDTNTADADWQPYTSPDVPIYFIAGNGAYDVMVGLRGLPADAVPTWMGTRPIFNNVSPTITICNPTNSTVSVPLIQLQGYVSASLSKLTFDVSNALGIVTNQEGYWNTPFYDTNLLEFTTNSFQCYDIALTNGLNQITLHATDVAGNTATTNVNYTLDYSGDHTAPVLSLAWPTNGTSIAGTNFTIQAQMDDSTATVMATINSDTVTGLVERTGTVWLNNLSLAAGTNTVTLTATDAAGNMSTTNLTVVQGGVNVTIDPISSDQLNQSSVTVTGSIDNPDDMITVNGQGTYLYDEEDGIGYWEADNVPVSPSGMANLDVEVSDSGNPVAAQTLAQPQPSLVQVTSYQEKTQDSLFVNSCGVSGSASITRTVNWTLGSGGEIQEHSVGSPYGLFYGTCDSFVDLATNWNGAALDGESCDGAYSESLNPAWQSCALTQAVTETGNDDCGGINHRVSILSRTAETKIELVAGGLAQSGASRLILLKASADEYPSFDVDYWDPAPADFAWTPFYGGGSIPLPAAAIKIMGQTLFPTPTNTDVGETLISLPAGSTQDIALTAYPTNQNHYSFNVQAQDVTLKIFAITNGTAIDLSTNTPEFCVGQQVTFMAQFDPPIDYSNVVAHWHLPDIYVNASSQNNPPDGSLHYFNNPDLLTNLTTACWYVNGTGGTVSIGLNLLLPDGHSIPAAAKGNFTIYRPTFSDFTQQTFDLAWNFPSPLSWIEADMSWKVTVNSKYDGLYGITQLLLGTGVFYGTDGEYVLDGNSEIYGEVGTNGPSIYKANDPAFQTLDFEDSPTAPTTSLDLDFEDYLRFQPSGTNNIYITIGKNGWSVNASYNVLTGVFTPTNIPAATRPVDSDEFPEWNEFRPGGGN